MAAPKGNKFAAGCENSGRPLKYKNVEEMQACLDEYFYSCFKDCNIYNKDGEVIGVENKQVRPFTITGICIALDMTRETLLDYQDKDEFSDTIKRAKMKCHNYAEEQLFTNKSAAGVIFNMKNNYGWKDKTEQDVNLSGGLADELKAARERAGK